MAYDPQMALRFAAFAAGMQAVAGSLDRDELARLERHANNFDQSEPLPRAVIRFVAQVRADIRNRAVIEDLGRGLTTYICSLNRPDPVGFDRRDLFG